MFLGSDSLAKAATLPGFQPLRAFLQRLGAGRGEGISAPNERLPFEPDFHVLDDVSCAPIRRR